MVENRPDHDESGVEELERRLHLLAFGMASVR